MFSDVGLVQSHILTEALLARKAVVVLPRVAEQHGESKLVASAQLLRLKQKVGNLGKPAACGGVGAFEDDVALFENLPNVALLPVLHTESLYVPRNALSPAYPRFRARGGRHFRAGANLSAIVADRDQSRHAATAAPLSS